MHFKINSYIWVETHKIIKQTKNNKNNFSLVYFITLKLNK